MHVLQRQRHRRPAHCERLPQDGDVASAGKITRTHTITPRAVQLEFIDTICGELCEKAPQPQRLNEY